MSDDVKDPQVSADSVPEQSAVEPAVVPGAVAPRSPRRWILGGVAAVLAIAALVTGGLAFWKHHEDTQIASAKTDSVAAARKTVEAMFSYDFHTVDAELPKAGDGMTSSFKSDYMKLVTSTIAPAAKQKQLTVMATAQAAGVISADTNRAVVLLYVNQVTTSKDNPQNTVSPTRVRVNLDHDGGRWLVSSVSPI